MSKAGSGSSGMNSQNNRSGEQISDLKKINRQWRKLSGLHSRAEWSAAVVRAATAAEIATNFAIREEFKKRDSQLSDTIVEEFLKDSNGLRGKLQRFLLTLLEKHKDYEESKIITDRAYKISAKRNKIVHSGDFEDEGPATELIEDCRAFVHGIVRFYQPSFDLPQGGYPNEKSKRSAVQTTEVP
jgi:hypothetical protein